MLHWLTELNQIIFENEKTPNATLLGFSSIALIATSAQAQTVSTSIGDLVLGFRVTDGLGLGATQNLEVDLGNMSTFTSLGAGQTVTHGGFPRRLSSIYGANPASRSDLVFGAIAGDGRTSTKVPASR